MNRANRLPPDSKADNSKIERGERERQQREREKQGGGQREQRPTGRTIRLVLLNEQAVGGTSHRFFYVQTRC
jgi:hypothetical protein